MGRSPIRSRPLLRAVGASVVVATLATTGGLVTATPVHAATSASIGVIPARQQYPLDCEAGALQIALSALGISVSQDWLLAQFGVDPRAPVLSGGLPVQWGDPYQAFVGDVRGAWLRTGYGVYFPRIVAAAEAAGASAIGHEGWAPSQLYAEVAEGHPVVVRVSHLLHSVWVRHWTAWDGRDVWYSGQDHAQVLIGFDQSAQTVTLADPYDGQIHTFSMPLFENRFASFMSQAIVIEPHSPTTLRPVTFGPGHTDVFWTGGDGALWHDWLNGTTWSGPQSLGAATLGSDPQPVVISTGHLAVFWKGLDASVWYLPYDNGWGTVQMIPGTSPIGGPPQPVVTGGVLSIFWRGQDRSLWESTNTAQGQWSTPVSRGGRLASDPVPIGVTGSRTDVVWRGADGAVWEADNGSGSWRAPTALASGVIGSAPYVTSSSTGAIDVFWRGRDADLWHISGGLTWPAGPTSLGAGPLGSDPHPVSPSGSVEDVYWTGADGNLWHVTSATGGAAWVGPASLGGGRLGGDPAPITWGGDYVDVLWPGGVPSVWHNVDSGGWSGAQPVGDRP